MTSIWRHVFLLILPLSLAPAMPCREAEAATPLTTVRVASGFSLPLYVTAPPGDTARVFVVEQRGAGSRGRIRIIKNGTVLGTPFLTTDSLANGGEQGLLGLAFPPDYGTSGRFYINYTDSSGTTRIERRTVSANPDVANPTGVVILSIPQPYSNHNGGWIGFGPDGYLHVATGDGGSGGDPEDHAQNIDDLLGKILRLDVSGATYTSPPGNPYLGATPGQDEVWSYGLRNPWRCSFDRKTGDFLIADVGQGVWEEVDFMAAGTGAGANYGWRCFEGNAPFSSSATIPCGSCAASGCPKTFPAHEYSHGGVRCSITGGYVYRGCAIPDLDGTYFFADYCSNQIWRGRFQGGVLVGVVDATADLAPGGGLSINNITSFGEDARGEIYICDQGGEVFKIVPQAPVQEADMPVIQKVTPLGDTLGSSGVGNALLTGIVPFTDPGSRISGVGYLSAATIRECPEIVGTCLITHVRLAPFDIDIQACVNPIGGTLMRRFVFTNTTTGPRNLTYRDVITPQLRGDLDSAIRVTAASAGQSAVLTQYDHSSPDRWIFHFGVGSSGVVYSADVDTVTELEARVLADQPLSDGTSAGPAAVGLALGFDFGSLPAGAQDTVTVVTRIQTTTPTGVSGGTPPVPKAQLSFLGPMPFRTELLMEIGLPQTGDVSLDVFDLAGRHVRTLSRGITQAGRTPSRWDGKLDGGANAASGIYFLRLSSESGSLTRRIALVR